MSDGTVTVYSPVSPEDARWTHWFCEPPINPPFPPGTLLYSAGTLLYSASSGYLTMATVATVKGTRSDAIRAANRYAIPVNARDRSGE